MNPVMGVGAPWYTSGVHAWNGTAPTLNSRPTSSSTEPTRSRPSSEDGLRTASAISEYRSEPEYP